MHFVRSGSAFVLLGAFLSGCSHHSAENSGHLVSVSGGNELDRGAVATTLSNYANTHPVTMTIPVETRQPNDVDAVPSSEHGEVSNAAVDNAAMPRAMVEHGLVTTRFRLQKGVSTDYSAEYELSKTGEAAATNWKHVPDGYAVPVGSLNVGSVSGIQALDATHAQVTFACSIAPNDLGRGLPESTQVTTPFTSAYTTAPFTTAPQSCSASLTRFDDGWRISADS